MNRRGFLARLFAAPIVALALLKAPAAETWAVECAVTDETWYDLDDLDAIRRRYIEPAVQSMAEAFDARMIEILARTR